MNLTDFKYHKPESLNEACQILAGDPDSVLLAGGTDLLVEMKLGLRNPKSIVSLTDIPELREITLNENGLMLGAAVTHNAIVDSVEVQNFCPALAFTALQIGTDQIRNSGTIGGNLCTGASCCDFAPILIAMNAVAQLISTEGERSIPLRDFFKFHKQTFIDDGEIMTGIVIPPLLSGMKAGFEKFGLRRAASISVVSAAATLIINQEGTIESACIVLGAAAPTPVISESANRIISGCNISELTDNSELMQRACEAAVSDSIPIDDIRASAVHRRELIRALVKRVVMKLL